MPKLDKDMISNKNGNLISFIGIDIKVLKH
jgi:hypothetical protein